MRKMSLVLLVLVGVAGLGRPGWAQTDTISVTVSLESVVSVSVTPNAWNIGPIALNGSNGPTSFSATVGNTTTQLDIMASDAAGAWTIGNTPGLNQFAVSVANPVLALSNVYQVLAPSVVPYASLEFALTYAAPSSDDKGAGTNQNFTITLRASAAP